MIWFCCVLYRSQCGSSFNFWAMNFYVCALGVVDTRAGELELSRSDGTHLSGSARLSGTTMRVGNEREVQNDTDGARGAQTQVLVLRKRLRSRLFHLTSS